MVFSKVLVSAVAAASVAYAQCGGSSATVIQNQVQATAIGGCKTFKGDIQIQSGSGATLDFGQVGQITGKVSMDSDSQITTLKFSNLGSLGSLSLTNLTALSTLDFSALQTVGDMTLQNLAGLNAFTFGSGLQKAGTVSIENVQIASLSGITSATSIDGIVLSNCQYLQNISFNVKDVGTIDIGPNNVVQGQTVSLPNLETAEMLTFRNSTVVSTPNLRNVSNTLSLIGNKFTTYGASNLSWVGALVVQSNPQLTNLSFPSLAHINGSNSTLDVENNTALNNINSFPKLIDVSTGDAIFAGNIKNLSLPSLTNVAGAMTVLTTDKNFDCNPINGYSSNQVVKGAVKCTNGDAGAIGTTSGTSTGGGSSSSSSSSAAVPNGLPAFLTSGAFAALLAFLA